MFEQLKGRVDALGSGGASGGGAAASADPTPTVVIAPQGTPTTGPADLRGAQITWQRRTLNLAAVAIAGDVTLTGLSVLGASGQESVLAEYEAALLPRRVDGQGTPQLSTVYALPEPMLLTDGAVVLTFADQAPLTLFSEASVAPTGVRLNAWRPDASAVPFRLAAALCELPWEGLRVVPAPTDPLSNFTEFDASYTPPRRVEVVWPASGSPYLHVLVFSTASADGQSFSVPLSPGLPQ
ncbi:hypothetical protein [Deinococcus wulumuqiensis]|nr:hypothetical protein [Deinococcus wulumuqiensis]